MRSVLKHSLAFLLAFIFLLSFTGVRMLIHHCLSCETTDVAIMAFGSRECDDWHHGEAQQGVCHLPATGNAVTDCCTTHEHNEGEACGNCCKTETHYIKTEYTLTQERNEQRIEPVVFSVLYTLLLADETVLPAHNNPGSFIHNSDPPRAVGRDFVIFAHQLKIA
ncbi:MAG: hypothetical protein RG741_08295 [Bacteroidales bacterium]|nr:hypothetical protein [Bacteroidales bacterium]